MGYCDKQQQAGIGGLAGADTIVLGPADMHVELLSVFGGPGNDVIDGSNGTDYVSGDDGDDQHRRKRRSAQLARRRRPGLCRLRARGRHRDG